MNSSAKSISPSPAVQVRNLHVSGGRLWLLDHMDVFVFYVPETFLNGWPRASRHGGSRVGLISAA